MRLTDRDVDRFASSCGPNKQARLLMRHKLLHEEGIPHSIHSRYYDLIECHFLQNTIGLYQHCNEFLSSPYIVTTNSSEQVMRITTLITLGNIS